MSPRLSKFYGIVITMYWDDHNPPHIHVDYGEYLAIVDFQRLEIIQGRLPRRAQELVFDWCELHENELIQAWDCAKEHKPLPKIFPLD
jgi:hypothetical protein